MNRDLHPDPTSVDDVELARLVHDVAEDWTMPALRLDQPGWRERVRLSRGQRRPFDSRAWLRRLAGAAGVALVLTIAIALLGVWLTLPRASEIGKPGPSVTASPLPSTATNSPRATEPASPSPLPALMVQGDQPGSKQVVVELEDGSFALVDLATGELASPFAVAQYGSRVGLAPDGSLYCLCVSLFESVNGAFTHATVSFNSYDRDGKLVASKPVGDFRGEPDPRDGAVPEQPEHVRVAVSLGDDPRYAFVGWSERAHPVWHSGLIVVDVTNGTVAKSLDLPDATTGEGETRRMTDAPRVIGGTGGSVIIGRGFYTWSPPAATEPNPQFSTDAYSATFLSGRLGTVKSIPAADGCGELIELGGVLPDGGTWLSCAFGSGSKMVRRIAADGTSMGDTNVAGNSAIDGSTSAVSPDGSTLYLWQPIDLKLIRVDVATGEQDSIAAPKPAAAGRDLLSAFGRWLVPSAQAKMFLRAGIAVSPDGQHVYTLGVGAMSAGRTGSTEGGGSAGLYAFSVGGSMAVERWEPTADFVSVTVSHDGRFVYAAGMPGVDATGEQTSQPASITVYDATTGKVRLIAGNIGSAMVSFPEALLP